VGAILAWLPRLQWPDPSLCAENSWSCTFAELAIDFELLSGLRMQEHSLGDNTSSHRKAVLRKCMIQTAVRHGSGLKSKRNLFKPSRESLFSCFRIPRQIGLPVRPVFIMGRPTEYLVSKNGFRYRNPQALPPSTDGRMAI